VNEQLTRPQGAIVAPTPSAAIAAEHPLTGAGAGVTDPFWLERLAANRATSLVEAYDHLEEYGGLAYLRAAAGGEGVPDVRTLNDSHVYKILDSDIFKWVEAVAYEHVREPLDAALLAKAQNVVDLIRDSQTEDGSVHSWTRVNGAPAPFENWLEGHELYCGGHLIQAGVAWYRATGDRTLIGVSERYADRVAAARVDHPTILPLHPGMEMALVELYRESGERRFLDLAVDFLRRRGRDSFGTWRFSPEHFADHQPLWGSHEIGGHAVMALYLLCGAVDVAVETGDEELLAAAEAQWTDFTSTKMYITGGAGSRQHDEAFGAPYELSPDTAYAETCAAIASVMLSWRLLLATGKVRYADLIERTVYNGLLSGVSLDGHEYLYVNPLHVREAGRILSPDGYSHRKPWYECACCPPNLMRAISTIGQVVATENEDVLSIHQLISSRIQSADQGLALEVDSTVPFGDGRVSVRVLDSDGGERTIRIRVPEWSRQAVVTAPDGQDWTILNGYASVTRAWRAGDEVSMETGIAFDAVAADPRIDAYRGQRAIVRGPIVYAVEGPSLPDGVGVNDVRIAGIAEASLSSEPWLTVPTLRLTATVESLPPAGPSLYERSFHEAAGSTATVGLVPYFAWGNRGPAEMRVWLPVDSTTAF
jgi:DUF1680 family protein